MAEPLTPEEEAALRRPDLATFRLAFDTLVESNPQRGYSRERQRGWDEAVASVRALLKRATPAASSEAAASQGDERLDVERLARAYFAAIYPGDGPRPPERAVREWAEQIAREYAALAEEER